MKPIEIISVNFLILGLIAVAIYYLLSPRAQTIWLLVVSYFFYFTYGWGYLLVLLFMTICNYLLAHRIERTNSQALFLFGLALNVIPLFVLKTLIGPYGFIMLAAFYNADQAQHLTSILLPIGFSFYTLQIISYLTDVYHGRIAAEKDFIHFALFLAYFPKMLAGPIERAGMFLPQLKHERHVDRNTLERGLYLVLIGLLRKMIIADRLRALIPADIFSKPGNFTSLEKLIWLLIFSFALYNDFAGYASIVRGVSSLMGIELTANFHQPFFARSFSDFWTRWHVTLSEWLRDYIFYPTRRWIISRRWNRWLALFLPPIFTMLVSGYWHGAYLSILFWGFIHAVYLIVEQILQQLKILSREGWRARLYGISIFILVTIAWIPFASSGARTAMEYARSFFPPYTAAFNILILPDISLLPLLSFYLDWQENIQNDQAFPIKWKPRRQAWAIALAIVLLVVLTPGKNDISGFIYQGF